jgi:hypothetical protein
LISDHCFWERTSIRPNSRHSCMHHASQLQERLGSPGVHSKGKTKNPVPASFSETVGLWPDPPLVSYTASIHDQRRYGSTFQRLPILRAQTATSSLSTTRSDKSGVRKRHVSTEVIHFPVVLVIVK